ncbi:RidA family protein [Halobacterium litoreum]|uniref:RidA family protein n=1 Tax=Halobacterium litoreum TaxID=2039234 RepID=A0ABD5NI13_9EURY|nr:RidA family protein [Halobacterium litoreum]UHH12535.1 RidA family protein [Halobacterium litoreum]
MDKTLLGPGSADLAESDLDHLTYSVAVATEHETHVDVKFSGVAWPEGGLEHQVRTVLDFVERALGDVGGTLDDVVMLRWFVLDDHLSRETQARINDVRAEFFDPEHYPASTMVGVSSLLDDEMRFELEVEAEVPHDDWTTTAFVGDEHEEVPGETVRDLFGDGEQAAPGDGDGDGSEQAEN